MLICNLLTLEAFQHQSNLIDVKKLDQPRQPCETDELSRLTLLSKHHIERYNGEQINYKPPLDVL